jgi:SPP1 family predicted phage head-tail adaptor
MRAGKLDRTITIERRAETLDAYGVPSESWTTLATVRAELVQSSTREFLAAYGTEAEPATVFRIRYVAGLTTADRVTYAGEALNIVELKETGRRRGLEIRCGKGAP